MSVISSQVPFFKNIICVFNHDCLIWSLLFII